MDKRIRKSTLTIIIGLVFMLCSEGKAQNGWYTEGKDYAPSRRIKITVSNPLNMPIKGCPVTVPRTSLPYQNIPERWIGIVDPALPSDPEPTMEQLKAMSGYVRRKETNGHYVELQVDDIDKDGIWDEIFFMTDLKPKESRDFYIYIDAYERGMYEHQVHAAIANYGRHIVPLWESMDMGWKLWYPHDVDLHGKRDPMLTAYYEYSTNKSGYYMPWEMGTDIMTVASTFGAGGMAVFENPSDLEHPTRAYHTPFKNMGPFQDTRFAFDVIYNGPLRSMIKVSTSNWNSGKGFYELDQYYTAVAGKSWTRVENNFSKFLPPSADAKFGAGIRRIMNEYSSVNKKGFAISMGKDVEARIPDEDIGDEVLIVPWQAIAVAVKDEYKPEYYQMKNYGGNHLLSMPATPNKAFEYLIFGAWSFGKVINNEKDFVKYVEEETLKYNHPTQIKVHALEVKGK
jgi:hypothetical protein